MGRAFKRCLPLKFSVLLRTAAEVTQIGYCVFSGRFFWLTLLIQTPTAVLFKPCFGRIVSAPTTWRGKGSDLNGA
jgi:hypothetical protein